MVASHRMAWRTAYRYPPIIIFGYRGAYLRIRCFRQKVIKRGDQQMQNSYRRGMTQQSDGDGVQGKGANVSSAIFQSSVQIVKMEAKARGNKQESSSNIDFWRSAISIKHHKLCSELRIAQKSQNKFREHDPRDFRRNDSEFSRVRSLNQVLTPTSPKLTSIKECDFEVDTLLHRRHPVPSTKQKRSPSRSPLSPPNLSRIVGGGLSPTHAHWLKETTSTMELDDTIKKRSRSPTIKEIQRIQSRAISRDDFEIIRSLGRGRLSNVYLVSHKATNFLAAMKVISKADIHREGVDEPIRREISIHSSISHPYIVQFYTNFEDAHNVYIVSELASEGQLYKKMQEKRFFSEKTCAIIIGNVLQAVAHLHHRKILHRDIKPQNIVLVHGVAKLCDLGWSVRTEGNLRQTFCGTPLYASPELIKGQPYDTKHDLWAIGVLAYELYYGRLPFDIKKGADLGKIVKEDIEFPPQRAPTAYFRDFVSTTLSKDPKKRMDCDQMLRHPLITRYRQAEACEQLL